MGFFASAVAAWFSSQIEISNSLFTVALSKNSLNILEISFAILHPGCMTPETHTPHLLNLALRSILVSVFRWQVYRHILLHFGLVSCDWFFLDANQHLWLLQLPAVPLWYQRIARFPHSPWSSAKLSLTLSTSRSSVFAWILIDSHCEGDVRSDCI